MQRIVLEKGSLWSLFLLCGHLWLSAYSATVAAAQCDLSEQQMRSLPIVSIARVFDGDTVALSDGRKVRFIGINTPEVARQDQPVEPIADQARAALLLWQGKRVYMLVGNERKDHYGRTLAHLFALNGSNLTAYLLEQGLGFTVTLPPNERFADCYTAKAALAREQQLGVWRSRYHRIRSTSLPADLKGGFGRYRGKIERIYVSKKVIWVDMFGDVSLRIARKDQAFVDGQVLSRLLKAADEDAVLQLPQLEFSGWLIDRTRWGRKMVNKIKSGKRKRWQMNIRHRNHWRLANL
ncbi:MAG: hypothetical protein CSA49_03310 [Gammaproteobacteria bacterium]|nr:MAG: hypothetical protein CSA49_03310 [Gammaproteobacteria bacterium]